MQQLFIVVADDSRARLFTVDQPDADGRLTGHRLAERADLANPDARQRGADAATSTDGRKRRATAGSAHGYPDHRPGHADEVRRRFAQRIIGATDEFIKRHAIDKIVMFAPPKMLGALRQAADETLPGGLERCEFAEELSWHSVATIQETLLRRKLLPERVPVGTYRPHGQEP